MADWRWSSWTDIGDRESNQDCAGQAVEAGRSLFVVCDGLGGHAGGARASRIAVDALVEFWRANGELEPRERLHEGIRTAHRAVQTAQKESEELKDMRTTLVALSLDGERATWAHVGDSRLYHFSGAEVAFQTRDHSVPQMLVASGDLELSQVRGHPDRNRLLGTLGNADEVRPSLRELDREVGADDAFLLCTDGFWDYVVESVMGESIVANPEPEACVAALRRAHEQYKDDDADNVTLTLVRRAG